ncbi:MAG TPA: hypothetical protein VN837_05480 [Chloroflexota bacterium]|nr:hypothetical protein [Chloroflexota bacterium]
MTSMSEAKRDHIRALARATTEPTPGVMPAWVANKPSCRWCWEHLPAWRREVDGYAIGPHRRAALRGWARQEYAEDQRRRRLAELESVMTRMDGDGLHFPGEES